MTGSTTDASSADAAAVARERLDRAAELASSMERSQRDLIAGLLELWPTSAWIAAGATSAKAWLLAYSGVSEREAFRLERIAGLCAAHPALATAAALLELNAATADDAAFDEALRYWTARVDEHLAPRRDHPHTLVACQRLFGGGQMHADLAPSAFLNVMTAIDAWTQDPDPTGAPTSARWPNGGPTPSTTSPTTP